MWGGTSPESPRGNGLECNPPSVINFVNRSSPQSIRSHSLQYW